MDRPTVKWEKNKDDNYTNLVSCSIIACSAHFLCVQAQYIWVSRGGQMSRNEMIKVGIVMEST